jgi:integrator complex subunit 7
MNAFNDTGLGEPEQDANTALIELDKGIFLLLILLFYY